MSTELEKLLARADWWRITLAAIGLMLLCWLIGLPSCTDSPDVARPPVPGATPAAGKAQKENKGAAIKPSQPLTPH